MIWVLKAFVQKTISYLPYKHQINYFFQKHITKGVHLTDALFEDKLTHCGNHLRYFKNYYGKKNFNVLEIGTGWYPVVPLGMYLCGAEKITTVDISALLKTDAVHQTIEKFLDYQKSGKLGEYIKDIETGRLEKMKQHLHENAPPRQLLNNMNIESIVGDARNIDKPDGSYDLIISNNTLEHIYPQILTAIMKELKRLSHRQTIMSHFIDMSDHFAHLDKSITPYHFLKFSDAAWSCIDNSIQPQNRLRITDYRKMLHEAGFRILHEENRAGDIEAVRAAEIHPKFRSYTLEDIAVTHSLIISAPLN
jgi:SAM-dependent methyltransferase